MEKLTKRFGGLVAVDEVGLVVRRGEAHALIGPNGPGKPPTSTSFQVFTSPRPGPSGSSGGAWSGCAQPIARGGMARSFQNLRLFRALSVWENVLVGAGRAGGSEAEACERAAAAIEFVGLSDKAYDICQNLPYGYQKLVELARAIAGEPELLLLDEPGAGLNQTEKQELVRRLPRLNDMGLTIMIVEHDMSLVCKVATTATVLNFGKKIAEGSIEEVLQQPAVVEAYLGNREVALNV